MVEKGTRSQTTTVGVGDGRSDSEDIAGGGDGGCDYSGAAKEASAKFSLSSCIADIVMDIIIVAPHASVGRNLAW